ncbi:MAG: hypothetical protein ACR2P0_02400 [Acidimicrobiales bacterium]
MRRPLRSDLARSVADLAIELGDPARMARARRLYRAGAVNGLDVAPGRLEAGVYEQGAPQHSTTIETTEQPTRKPLPAAAAIVSRCTCDDEAPACVHVLATVLSFAEEVEVAPELVGDWTAAVEPESSRPAVASDQFFSSTGFPTRRRLRILDLPTGTLGDIEGIDAYGLVADARDALSDALSADAALRSPT